MLGKTGSLLKFLKRVCVIMLNCVAEFCKIAKREFLLRSENCGGQFGMSAVV